MRATVALSAPITLCLLFACTERPQRDGLPAKVDLSTLISSSAPSSQHVSKLRFADRVELVGYDVDTRVAVPGQAFTVTWYWHVLRKPDKGTRQFTHGIDKRGKSRLNLDSARVLDRIYRPDAWEPGQFITDVQEVTLPKDWKSSEVVLAIGFWNGEQRLAVSAGSKDAEGRGVGLTLPVGDGRAPPVPQLVVPRSSSAPVLDGKLDEPMWKEAARTGPFVNTMRGDGASFQAEARVAHGASGLHVAFEVEDAYLKSGFDKHDDHLWEQDVVEIMLDPDGDGRNYFEMQVSPKGIVFDTRYDRRRRPRPFGDMGWNSGLRAGVALRGAIDEQGDDRGYTVELTIPWSAVAAGSKPAAPPTAGAQWRMNLFVMDADDKRQRAAGWSPPLVGDFHILERFGILSFPEAAVPGAHRAVLPAEASTGDRRPDAGPRGSGAQNPKAPSPATN